MPVTNLYNYYYYVLEENINIPCWCFPTHFTFSSNMEWVLIFCLVFGVHGIRILYTGRDTGDPEYSIDPFEEILTSRSERKVRSAKRLRKVLSVPFVTNSRNEVTFSLNSLDISDSILKVQLQLPAYWAPKNYPYNFTSLRFKFENDFFMGSPENTWEARGVFFHEIRTPNIPHWNVSKRLRNQNVTFHINVTGKANRHRAIEIFRPLVTIEPILLIVTRNCLNSGDIADHLKPFIGSQPLVDVFWKGRIHKQFILRNTTNTTIFSPLSVTNFKPIELPLLLYKCRTTKKPLGLSYSETDNWNRTTHIFKRLCRMQEYGVYSEMMEEQVEECFSRLL